MDPLRYRLARGAILAAAIVVAGSVTACGGDADDPATARSSSSETATAAGSFCDDYVVLAQGLSTAPWNADPSVYPSNDAMVAYYDSSLAPLVERVAADEVPAAINADVAAQVEALHAFGAAGDLSAIDTPMYFEAGDAADAYVYENCDLHPIEVAGVDYAFSGLPQAIDTGATAFRFTNRPSSEEPHELLILRKNDDVAQSFDELLDLLEDEALDDEATVVAKAFAFSGESVVTFANLQQGSYVAVCTITRSTLGHSPGGGPPHFTIGMRQEFTVGP